MKNKMEENLDLIELEGSDVDQEQEDDDDIDVWYISVKKENIFFELKQFRKNEGCWAEKLKI